jgi:hypothetical protein
VVLLLALFLAGSASPARAWLYPEHRAITARGIDTLDPRHRAQLDRLWMEARKGYESRLCEQPDAGDQGQKPACIDYAAWPAISGDHSCSPETMLQTVLESDWILKVAAITARMAAKIAASKNEAERRNWTVDGDLRLTRTDPEYTTRAVTNTAHFLLPRESEDPAAYVPLALGAGAELNAYGTYVLFHIAAMHTAATVEEQTDPAQRSALARRLAALEAFALHFLEDSFAAGHIAGSWGSTAERRGTHDYYNEHGLDTETWGHKRILLFGDGHMTEADLERGGEAVRASLEELAQAAQPDTDVHRLLASTVPPPEVLNGKFDVCKGGRAPEWKTPDPVILLVARVLRESPIPYRGPGYASLPRFRAEIGPFIGLASGISAAGAGGGFTSAGNGGFQGQLDLGVRVGVGLEGVLGDSGDGLIFLQFGVLGQSKSTSTCTQCPNDPVLQQFAPGVPARSGYQFRLRVPFWLIPGDLLLAAPVLAFTSKDTLTEMGITAVDGGLIPWQAGLQTPVGRVQVMAGREVGATLFGFGTKDAFVAAFDTNRGRIFAPIAIKSIQWDFPLLEIRPFREYGARFTYATLVQVGAGFDKPLDAEVVGRPELGPPPLKTRYFGFVRIFFDGRRYF